MNLNVGGSPNDGTQFDDEKPISLPRIPMPSKCPNLLPEEINIVMRALNAQISNNPNARHWIHDIGEYEGGASKKCALAVVERFNAHDDYAAAITYSGSFDGGQIIRVVRKGEDPVNW